MQLPRSYAEEIYKANKEASTVDKSLERSQAITKRLVEQKRALAARIEALNAKPINLWTTKEIRKASIRNLINSERARHTIRVTHYLVWLQEHMNVEPRTSVQKAIKKYGIKRGQVYAYIKRYLVQRHFVLKGVK
jgi:hypothetical protein